MIYPSKISATLTRLRHAGRVDGNAVGSDANFVCGSFVRFRVIIDKVEMTVTDAGFESNGCGYMLSAAETLAEAVSGKKLSELHGLDVNELSRLTSEALGEIESPRTACVLAAAGALRNAFADFRSRQIEEFRGEKALVCTCFGITEEAIEAAINDSHFGSVEEVAISTNAGSGCGSCRMFIQEILDSRE